MNENEDIIQIKGLSVFASVGVSQAEREHKQKLLIDVKMETRYSFDSLGEDLSLTADYAQVVQKIHNLCATVSYQLIETLAVEIVHLLLAQFPLKKVTVRIRKFILPDTEFVAVQTTRGRSY